MHISSLFLCDGNSRTTFLSCSGVSVKSCLSAQGLLHFKHSLYVAVIASIIVYVCAHHLVVSNSLRSGL